MRLWGAFETSEFGTLKALQWPRCKLHLENKALPKMESPPLPAPDWGRPPVSSDDNPPPASRPIARWRWFVATLLVGAFPFAAALSSTIRVKRNGGGEATLPSSVEGLLLAGALQLAFILLFFGAGWLFSRATRAELWMPWRKGIAPLWQGALYSIGLRFLPILPLIAVGIVLTILGFKPEALGHWISANRPQTDGIGDSIRAGSALYKALMLTFFSFVVAGWAEELWRVATMRGLIEIAPRKMPPFAKNAVAVLVSALVFGIGHLYQGVIGVCVTAFIGVALGAITLYHRSIWPAVIAHGCFDAASFLMVVLGADKLAPQQAWWHFLVRP